MFEIVIGGIITISLPTILTFIIWILVNRNRWKKLLKEFKYDVTKENRKFVAGLFKLAKKWKKVLQRELDKAFEILMIKGDSLKTVSDINKFVDETLKKVDELRQKALSAE